MTDACDNYESESGRFRAENRILLEAFAEWLATMERYDDPTVDFEDVWDI
ncbi:MAG: hypothetical protein GF388_09575 [Candidatus Aegiribacteria sp.]|nr:hypothetical protein [Candidatus Aegiribacteria sp.]MBD3295292.1 hypothetical protein [Candidatus Fermentibacteria bacterium]